MTKRERREPVIIDGSRRTRIAGIGHDRERGQPTPEAVQRDAER